jgi:hypothetical protein
MTLGKVKAATWFREASLARRNREFSIRVYGKPENVLCSHRNRAGTSYQ